MSNLNLLYEKYNQSPWLDNLSRDLIQSGKLNEYINNGIRGLTSNPTILENAITSSSLYNEQIRQLSHGGLTSEEIYWQLVEDDIKAAANYFLPLWQSSNGVDGYVSLEVSPTLADDTEATIKQAELLWTKLNLPNLMIKVPGTEAGLPAIEHLLEEGININVTLLFSLKRYAKVIEAYQTARHNSDKTPTSVASFFISRIDTLVDSKLSEINSSKATELMGKSAVSFARLAYYIYLNNFSKSLVLDDGPANAQRILWASTSTKNPNYDDLIYVKDLIGKYTVTTLPENTISKIVDHLPQTVNRFSAKDIFEASQIINEIQSVGIDFDKITDQLEREGVQKFKDSFTSLMSAIDTAKNQLV